MDETNSSERSPEKRSCIQKVCQSKLCIPAVVVGLLVGVAVAVSVVLTSDGVRDRYPPDLKWWQKTVVYQIYPRSFKDSDGDGIGDLQGIISKLDYFDYLNVGAIWISPFYPSPMKDFGYDVSDYVNVDPMFGDLNDFDQLVKQAHDKGIKIIIDFVASHTSSEHFWFNQSVQRIAPYDDYYIWANGTKLDNGTVIRPSNWVSSFGYSGWKWVEERQQYYFHKYLDSQPMLNYRSPHVGEEIKKVLRFWLDRGVDGVRADAVSSLMVYEDYYQDQVPSNKPGAEPWQADYYVTNLTLNVPGLFPIIKEWSDVIHSYGSGDDDKDDSRVLIVEAAGGPEVRSRYMAYGADMPFNFDLIKVIGERKRLPCDATCMRDAIQREYDSLSDGAWANFVFSSHDVPRASKRLGSLYVDAMNMLLLTLRGTPTSYYGEELGMENIEVAFNETQDPFGIHYGPDHYKEVSRDPERSPMQWNSSQNAGFSSADSTWLPVHPDYQTVNVQTEKDSNQTESLQVYRDLAILRKQPSLQYGKMTFATVTPNILSFFRSANGRPGYLVALNFGNVTETHDFSGSPVGQDEGRVKVVTSRAANSQQFTKGQAVSLTSVELEPGDGLVLEVDSTTSD